MLKKYRLAASIVIFVLVSVLLTACTSGTTPQPQAKPAYPTKPIQLIIPWPAGGASDLATRLLAKYAEKELGQPITPVNKDGANGATGWADAVKATPDGYTISLVTFDIITNQALGRSPVKWNDFDYLLQFSAQPLGIAVNADSPYKTLDDLVKAAKANPNTITISSTPLGGIYHQAIAMLEKASGAKFRVVPFPGSAEVNTALLGKHVDAQINTLTLLDQHVKSGAFKMLAVTSENKVSRYPDVPTLKDLKYDIVHESFRAMAIPKNVPAEVKKALTDAYTKAFNNKEYQDAAEKAKYDAFYRTSEDFGKFVSALYPKVDGILTELGMKK